MICIFIDLILFILKTIYFQFSKHDFFERLALSFEIERYDFEIFKNDKIACPFFVHIKFFVYIIIYIYVILYNYE